MIGIGSLTRFDHTLPPVPAGWLIGIVFLTVGSALIISALTLYIHKDFKQKERLLLSGMLGVSIVVMGVKTLALHPYNVPGCVCPEGYYGLTCKPCDCVNGNCLDGSGGNGVCICDMGWGGPRCDRCSISFEGSNCDRCKRGWTGDSCDRCYPGYTGTDCDRCAPNWVRETDSIGLLCRHCKPGFYGGYCTKCPACNAYDKDATCKDNDWWRQQYNGECTQTAQSCQNDYDCSSFNCKGMCMVGDVFTNVYCESDLECGSGTCEFKSCCIESRVSDGECECKRDGYWGPLCQPCPGFDGVYSNSICTGHGTCAAAYVENNKFSHLTCECDSSPTWSGQQCGCLLEDGKCTECADGMFGETCTTCPGGGGISQCDIHGKCNDGIDGDGTCTCDLDIKTGGLGGWKPGDTGSCDACFSSDFYGNACKVCKDTIEVGFPTRELDKKPNTELPNGNYLLTCPEANQVCSDTGGCI